MANDNDQVQGEGNYEAARRYRERTEEFVRSGKVEDAARNALPRTESDARDLERAEEAGRQHIAEEDRLLNDEDATDLPPR